MKENELMIGDWVFVPHNGSATHFGRVCGIYDGGAVSNTLEKDSGLTKASALEPIPITPEILKKNGFICEDKFIDMSRETTCIIDEIRTVQLGFISVHTGWKMAWCQQTCQAHIYKVDGGEYWGQIHFVHQLQHALCLCGVEREIVV